MLFRSIGTLIAFSIITETVFQWPGMGFLFIQAVQFVDIPIMSAYLVFIAFVFVMMPVWEEVNTTALDPYLQEAISQEEFMSRAALPIKRFMGNFTREKDLALFIRIAKIERPKNIDEVPIWVMIHAFVISELKAAFQIGFLLYVPFLVIDMVVASILMAMGMMMMPPVMISLPFKLMLFVLVDGWHLILGSMVKSFVDL